MDWFCWENLNRKPWFLQSNIGVSCRFFHHPVLWINGGFSLKTIHKWWIFHCHFWLPEGAQGQRFHKKPGHRAMNPPQACGHFVLQPQKDWTAWTYYIVTLPSGKQTVCYWTWSWKVRGFTHWKWWFSIVMLVYQRVYVYFLGCDFSAFFWGFSVTLSFFDFNKLRFLVWSRHSYTALHSPRWLTAERSPWKDF